MESDKSYRARLKNQIKDACGKVIYTYTAHHKLADRLEKENKYVKNAQIILTALSSCGFFASIITNKVILTWVGGIAAVLSLCLNLYAKEYKIQNEVSQHRNAANMLWGIREEYVSLLVDFEVLDDSEIQKREMFFVIKFQKSIIVILQLMREATGLCRRLCKRKKNRLLRRTRLIPFYIMELISE